MTHSNSRYFDLYWARRTSFKRKVCNGVTLRIFPCRLLRYTFFQRKSHIFSWLLVKVEKMRINSLKIFYGSLLITCIDRVVKFVIDWNRMEQNGAIWNVPFQKRFRCLNYPRRTRFTLVIEQRKKLKADFNIRFPKSINNTPPIGCYLYRSIWRLDRRTNGKGDFCRLGTGSYGKTIKSCFRRVVEERAALWTLAKTKQYSYKFPKTKWNNKRKYLLANIAIQYGWP